jgi:hypothetical protein
MIFVTLLLIFCYILHNMCAERGLSPWSYLGGFIAGYFFGFLGTSIAIVLTYGPTIINDPDVEKKVMNFIPFTFIYHFLLFVFFWHKISKVEVYHDEDDDVHLPPPPSKEKKDLSYFR